MQGSGGLFRANWGVASVQVNTSTVNLDSRESKTCLSTGVYVL